MRPALKVGRNIRRIRRAADITQERLALDADVSRPSVTLYERGHRLPHLEVVFKLAAVLEVEPGAFLEGVRWEPAAIGKSGRWIFDGESR